MGVLETAGTAIQISRYRLWDRLHRGRGEADLKVQGHIKQVQQTGFSLIKDFYSPAECAEGRDEIDRLISRYEGSLNRPPGNETDARVYGGERVSPVVNRFYSHPFLGALTAEYHRAPIMNMSTLAARIEGKDGNLGSGGGWHRDSVHIRQFKTLLYLSDVDETNGPFQYLEGSHTFNEIQGLVQSGYSGFNQYRYQPQEIARLVRDGRYPVRTFAAGQGTLVLVDTRGIHRGKPLSGGVRYAFTNYYYARHHVTSNLNKKFAEIFIDA